MATANDPGATAPAGESVPKELGLADAMAYAQRLSDPFLFNHAMRSWLFAVTIGRAKALPRFTIRSWSL